MRSTANEFNHHAQVFSDHTQATAQEITRDRLTISAVVCNMFTNFYARFGQVLNALLASSDEPSITQIADPKGQIWWRIEDPQTGRLHWCESDTEVMIWLDNYKYRSLS